MKYFIILITLCISFTGCAQTNQTNKQQTMEMKELLESLISSVQKYDYEPQYMIGISSNTNYILLVNDMPAFSHFEPSPLSISFYVNHAILSAGIQDIELKLYPQYKDKNSQYEYLSDSIKVQVNVLEITWAKDGHHSKPIMQYELENDEESLSMIRKGNIKELKKKITFQADVPYVLTGWSESQDLRKENREALLTEVVEVYKKRWNDFSKRDSNNIWLTEVARDRELYQCDYLSKEEIVNKRKSLTKFLDSEFEMVPLEDYELCIFGHGKVVGLVSTIQRDRGDSPLQCEYVNDLGQGRVSFFDLLLHRPKGSDKLEVIR